VSNASQRDQQYPLQYNSNPRMMSQQLQQPRFLGEEQYLGTGSGYGRIGYDQQQQYQQQSSPYNRASFASAGPSFHRTIPPSLVGQQFSNSYQQEEVEYSAMVGGGMQLQRPQIPRSVSTAPIVPPLALGGSRETSSLIMSFRNANTPPQLSSSPSSMHPFPMMHAQISPSSHLNTNGNHSTSSEFFSEEGKTTIGHTGLDSGPNTARGSVFSGLGVLNSSNSFTFGRSDSFSISPREPLRQESSTAPTIGLPSLNGAESVRCMQCGRSDTLLEPFEAALAAHYCCDNCVNGGSDSQQDTDTWR
jgi:hypothetical protein